MPDEGQPFMLELTAAQVNLVANAANARQARLHLLLAAASSEELAKLSKIDLRGQLRISKSLLHGLMALSIASSEGPVGPTRVSEVIGLSGSSSGIYLKTWAAIGVLERIAPSHLYQLAQCWRR